MTGSVPAPKTRMVSANDWILDRLPDEARRQRLLAPPSAETILERLIFEAMAAAEANQISLRWQPADDAPGYYRIIAQIPIGRDTFDLLFNGRSGYRAQYYLSPEEGILYNRQIIHGLAPAIRSTYNRTPVDATYDLIERSLYLPHSKIWVWEETSAFGAATPNTLNPERWSSETIGRRVPLPDAPKIDLKGCFIDPNSEAFFVDDTKLDRAGDLHRKGFS